MGLSYTIRLYKGCDKSAFEMSIETVVTSLGGIAQWYRADGNSSEFRTGSSESVQSLYVADHPNIVAIGSRIGAALKVPWIELRIQEGAIWDYSLYRGVDLLDEFSVCPQFWEGPDIEQATLQRFMGNSHLLASVWQIPVKQIDQYIVNWGFSYDVDDVGVFHYERSGLAYPDDKHRYGNYEQIFDFVKKLGGKEPTTKHSLSFPGEK